MRTFCILLQLASKNGKETEKKYYTKMFKTLAIPSSANGFSSSPLLLDLHLILLLLEALDLTSFFKVPPIC